MEKGRWHRRFGVKADGAAHCASLKAATLPLKADAGAPRKSCDFLGQGALPLSED